MSSPARSVVVRPALLSLMIGTSVFTGESVNVWCRTGPRNNKVSHKISERVKNLDEWSCHFLTQTHEIEPRLVRHLPDSARTSCTTTIWRCGTMSASGSTRRCCAAPPGPPSPCCLPSPARWPPNSAPRSPPGQPGSEYCPDQSRSIILRVTHPRAAARR